jgi:hypothetical protein
MSEALPARLTNEELMAEGGTLLPAKEVLSLLDLVVDLDLMLDLAAPIDLAVAANANVAAPVNAAVSANVLSVLSNATAAAEQNVPIDQAISGDAIANAPQTSVIDQGDSLSSDGSDGGAVTPTEDPALELPTDPTDPTALDPTSLLDGDLVNIDVNAVLDADLAAPVAGAVAANANAAVPINVSAAANVGSLGSSAVALASQEGSITQNLADVTAEATADQDSTILQGTDADPATTP